MTASGVLGPNGAGTAVSWADGRIAEVTSAPDITPAQLATLSSWIERGRVNAHTHIYSGLAPFGMPAPEPAPESFPEILERVWWRLDRALDARALRASARLYVAEALLRGTTTLVDHHESPNFIEGSLDVIADACEELGVRAVLCYGATERNGGREEARRGLAECARFVRENRRPLVRGLVGLHASFTVSDETIREAAALCRELDTVMHVHLAEDACDLEDARRRGYEDPLERLFALDALPRGSIVAHAVHLGAAAIRRLADAGVWIVQNPRSNHGNRVGYPPALGESARVALGTDGYPADLAEEAGALAAHAQANGEKIQNVVPRATAGYALLAERFDASFALEPGAAADLVELERDDARVDAPLGVRRGAAREAIVAGRRVVSDSALVHADAEAIRAEAREAAPALWKRMRAVGPTGRGER